MAIDNAEKVEILIEALPYVKKYADEIIVIKYGGNAMINGELKKAVMGDIVLLNQIGVKVVLVHGGGPEISDMLKKVGKETKFIEGLRQTDEETAEIVQMVLSGKVNKNLVGLIGSMGGRAIGLCGMDGNMLEVKKLSEELGFVGEIVKTDVSVIEDALDKGYIPVISTTGFDSAGRVYNINADTAAAKIAGQLKAHSMISMTDIRGILKDKNDPDSLISVIEKKEAEALVKNGVIDGGMIPKVECCIDALKAGVRKVFITDGRVPHSVLIELLSDEGVGTMFVEERI